MDRNYPVIGNCHPVGVAAEICQYLVRGGTGSICSVIDDE
jgi:hypothetical protein